MAIDFTLTPRQRKIQLESREFARDIVAGATSAEMLPTPEERFLATKPIYEAMVAAGFLRKCIPTEAGGDSTGMVEVAILAEEFYCINASVTLTMFGTLLGLLPILLGGAAEQRDRLLVPFLKKSGVPLAGFCATEPGGSANAASPPPGEGVRTTAKLEGEHWVIRGQKNWVSSATGWDRKGADVLCVVCRTDASGPPEKAASIIAVERPAAGLVFERAIDPVGHRAHLLPQFRFDDELAARDAEFGQEVRYGRWSEPVRRQHSMRFNGFCVS
jgi:nitroalkane oxidase